MSGQANSYLQAPSGLKREVAILVTHGHASSYPADVRFPLSCKLLLPIPTRRTRYPCLLLYVFYLTRTASTHSVTDFSNPPRIV